MVANSSHVFAFVYPVACCQGCTVLCRSRLCSVTESFTNAYVSLAKLGVIV